MTQHIIENLNIYAEEPLIAPQALKADIPLSDTAKATVLKGQTAIKNILDGSDPRIFVVVGPCSIHDIHAAKEYARALKALSDELQDTLVLVMRVYFEKPRTRTGWSGLINDPDLDGSCQIEKGLYLARQLLLDIAQIGVPSAGEALDLISPQYLQDLFSWTAIGARTTESQTHRKMASAFTSAVGFKNGTDGNIQVAINAMVSASSQHHFLSVAPNGQVAVVRTKGNPHTHIVLRGGKTTNYQAADIQHVEQELTSMKLPVNLMIDCSHANSSKQHQNQLIVLDDVAQQIQQGNQSIVGLMIESNLNPGRQDIPLDLDQLHYGVSVTDACIGWEETAQALRKLRNAIKDYTIKRRS